MEKKIVLSAMYDDYSYIVKIITQTHREYDFGNPGCDFTSSTGLILSSCSCPEVYEEDNLLYVRGDNLHADEQIFIVENKEFMQRIMHAVREYNTHVWVTKLPDVPTDSATFIVE